MRSAGASGHACPIEAASRGDAAFFQSYPHRQHRIRRAIPGEFGPGSLPRIPAGAALFAVVKQLSPGVRVRLSFFMRGEPAPTESAAAAVFAMLASPDAECRPARIFEEAGHA